MHTHSLKAVTYELKKTDKSLIPLTIPKHSMIFIILFFHTLTSVVKLLIR
jgi:hypothetical protein